MDRLTCRHGPTPDTTSTTRSPAPKSCASRGSVGPRCPDRPSPLRRHGMSRRPTILPARTTTDGRDFQRRKIRVGGKPGQRRHCRPRRRRQIVGRGPGLPVSRPRHRRTRSCLRILPVAFVAGRNDPPGHIGQRDQANAGAPAIRFPMRPQHPRDQPDASGSGSTPPASVEFAIPVGGGVHVVCVVAMSPMLVADLRPEPLIWPIGSVPPQR